jgi:hypothetical protein
VAQEAESLLLLERDLFREWFIWVFESPEEKGREQFLDVLDKVRSLYIDDDSIISGNVYV